MHVEISDERFSEGNYGTNDGKMTSRAVFRTGVKF